MFRTQSSSLSGAALFTVLALQVSAPLLAGTIRIDFGRNNGTDGNPTTGPDAFGNHWNNLSGDFDVAAGLAATNLVTTDNSPTTLGVKVQAGWKANGINTGGLLAPDPALLGDAAVDTATQDYFFVEGAAAKATMTISGLDPGKLYDFRFFGTRATNDVRETTFKITAGSGVSSVALQTSGPGTGNDGIYNGNDDAFAELTGVQSTTTTTVQLEVSVSAGGFGYLGVMEIIEGPAAPVIEAPVTTTGKVLIDFGRTDGVNGNLTSNPDGNGNHWNNFVGTATLPNGLSATDLVTSDNAPSSIRLTMGGGWEANGILNGGLLAPDPALLGDFAINTATQDYFFVNGAGATVSMTISGLNPGKLYDFRFFGTRATTDVRESTYKIIAASGTTSVALQTSGPGISENGAYNGNDNTIVSLNDIQADASTSVQLDLTVSGGGFGYLGAMEITEGASVPPILAPPPGSVSRWYEQDALDPVAPGSVLFVGSSSIRRWEGLARDFADYRITQRGFGGSQLSELNSVADYIVHPYAPSAIVVWEGTNDIKAAGKSAAQVNADFQTFVGLVRAHQPSVPILYLGIAPTPGYGADPGADTRRREANTLIAATCAGDATLHFVDLPTFFEDIQDNQPGDFLSYYVDDTHFSRKGYAEWTRIIRPQLESVLSPNKAVVANPDALATGESILFDFGPNDGTNGDPTNAVDPQGHTWNNWHATNGGGTVNSGEHLADLAKTTGAGSGIRMTITGGFQVNGKQNGGLFSPNGPDFTLLGDLAVETATEDYFFSTGDDLYNLGSDDVPGSLMLEGLNPSMAYEIRLFGSRNTTATRVTDYALSGLNATTRNLQTSGTDIGSNGTYDGNDDEVTVLTGMVPDRFGQLFLDITAIQGQFAYLNAMEITATAELAAIDLWRAGEFTPEELENAALESTLWGNDADPDSDGRSNLMEYATGTAARDHDAGTVAGELEQVGPDRFLTLTYRKNLAATDVNYQVEASNNLVFAEDIADSLLSAGAGFEIRKASTPMVGHPERFLRLKVELAP
ncbi:GDSL-type esterase/lipase family protein [Luteolibacter marinus]|uniref:GDSL-type esterase/lipase family protein n=1 Tax=Luteolibacter marinus TaxID=2776705 RepID=UPI0018662349|nr:GDSL-type esterase/lipase family protein [Luteolibacter marinus]